jgi:thioredoxin 1
MSKRKGDNYVAYKSMGGDKQTYEPDDKEITINNLGELDLFLNDSMNKLCVLYVYAKWCAPCKVIGPKYFELSKHETTKGVNLKKLDGENEICDQRGIRKIFNAFPTFLFFKNGKVVDKVVGADLDSIVAKIIKHK